MTKPTYIDWANTYSTYPVLGNPYDGEANKIAVTSEQEQYGWEPGKKPPAQNMNQWQNLAGQWVRRLDAGDSETQAMIAAMSGALLGGGIFYPGVPVSDYVAQYSVAVFCAGAGHCVPAPDGAARTITIGDGMLYQATSTELLAYLVTDNELQASITNGDATHPRVDLVQVKIEPDATVDGKRTKITMSVKAGTPAASPAVPAPDTGYVALCTVLVGTNWVGASGFVFDDTAGAVAVIHDQRIPINVRQLVVQGSDAGYDPGTWTLTQADKLITASNATPADVRVFCPTSDGGGRLLGAGVMCDLPAAHSHSGVDFQLQHRRAATGGIGINQVGQLTGSYGSGHAFKRVEQFRGVLDGTHTPTAGPTVTAYTSGSGIVLGVPTWTNGQRAHQWAAISDGEQHQLAILLTNTKNTQQLYSAWFWVGC